MSLGMYYCQDIIGINVAAIATTLFQFTIQVPYQGFDVHQHLPGRLNYDKPWSLRQALDGNAAKESPYNYDKKMLSYDGKNQREVRVGVDGKNYYRLRNLDLREGPYRYGIYENINGKRFYLVIKRSGDHFYPLPKTLVYPQKLVTLDVKLSLSEDPHEALHDSPSIHSNLNSDEKEKAVKNNDDLPRDFHFKR